MKSVATQKKLQQPIADPGQDIDFTAYIRVFVKRKWTIISIFVIVVTLVSIHTARLPLKYKATTRLHFSRQSQRLVSVDDLFRMESDTKDYLVTQLMVLRSRPLLEKVIEKLDLKNDEEFETPPEEVGLTDPDNIKIMLEEWYGKFVAFVKKQDYEPDVNKNDGDDTKHLIDPELRRREQLFREVASRIRHDNTKNSSMVNVSFVGYNPKTITKVINTLVQLYVEQSVEDRLLASEDAGLWLSDQLNTMRLKVEEAERALQGYREEVGIINFDERSKITAREISELNRQITEIKRKRLTWETLYENSLDPNLWDSLPAIIENPLIQELQISLATLENTHSELSKKYGPKHPKLEQLQSQIENADENISQEIEKIHESTYTEYQLAVETEKILLEALNTLKNEAAYINEKSIRYGFLLRDVESNRIMYDLLLKRLKETDLTSGIAQANVRIIDPAAIPLTPFEPNKKRKVLLGIILGLCGGIGMAFLIEHLDNTVKDPDEITAKFGVPFLGLVGHHTVKARKVPEGERDIKLISITEPTSTIAESLRTIRTNVLFSYDPNETPIMMITSALPGEGKTTIATNMAVVMASLGDKVLLIDADLRRPSIHKRFGITKTPGLSNYLIGQNTLEEVLHDSGVKNLSLIPCGVIPPNPSELLSHPQMRKLLRIASKDFSSILIDTAPVASVTDSLIIGRVVHAAVLVIRYRSTAKNAVGKAVQQLTNVGTNLMGAVLNDVDFSKDSYYYQYYSKYYYYREAPKG